MTSASLCPSRPRSQGSSTPPSTSRRPTTSRWTSKPIPTRTGASIRALLRYRIMGEPRQSLLHRLHHLHLRLSGNLDRAEPLPPPAGVQALLLPAADFVMALLYSRSRAGSL